MGIGPSHILTKDRRYSLCGLLWLENHPERADRFVEPKLATCRSCRRGIGVLLKEEEIGTSKCEHCGRKGWHHYTACIDSIVKQRNKLQRILEGVAGLEDEEDVVQALTNWDSADVYWALGRVILDAREAIRVVKGVDDGR